MPADAKHAAPRCKVLVVEDDTSSREALALLLGVSGFHAATAASIHQAMEQLAWEPSCVLLDLMLPDGNGATLLRHIRESGLPIRIGLTSGIADFDSLFDAELRPDAVFRKPLDFDEIAHWLNQVAARADATHRPSSGGAADTADGSPCEAELHPNR